MTPGQLARTARRRRGLSQRDFAAVADVSLTTLQRIEGGRHKPSFGVLERLLAAADLELAAVPRPPADTDEADLRNYLSRSLTSRLRLALGEGRWPSAAPPGPVWSELLTLSRTGAVVLQPPLAHRLWLPAGPALPAHVVVHRPHRSLPPLSHVHADTAEAERPIDAVPVTLQGPARVWVAPPSELATSPVVTALRHAADLLDREAARDDAERRRPAHKDANDWLEYDQVLCTKSVPNPRVVAVPEDSRNWRLGGPASLAQVVSRGGMVGRWQAS